MPVDNIVMSKKISPVDITRRRNSISFCSLKNRKIAEPIPIAHRIRISVIALSRSEIIPYSAISCWNTCGIIKKVTSKSDYKIDRSGYNVSFFLKKGDTVGDHERIFVEIE